MVPQASIEFEVADPDAVAAAGSELQRAGYELLHPARTEPWGQTVARLLTGDGVIVGISYAPAFQTSILLTLALHPSMTRLTETAMI